MDRRTKPERIAEVIRELDADVIALQEVLNVPGKPDFDQARYIARALYDYSWRFGETRPLHGGHGLMWTLRGARCCTFSTCILERDSWNGAIRRDYY